MDRGLNELLKWSIENTPPSNTNGAASTNGTSIAATPTSQSQPAAPDTTGRAPPNAEALAALFGGPSEADLMRAAVEVFSSTDPAVSLDDKLVAFDNLEQLIESLDNANNLANLGLWPPLLAALAHAAPEMRRMAAWCVGTAVQNNEPSQERLLAAGGVPPLVALVADPAEQVDVRRKGVYALSSAVRNYQPAMDVLLRELGKGRWTGWPDAVEATNMEAVDEIINRLKEELKAAS